MESILVITVNRRFFITFLRVRDLGFTFWAGFIYFFFLLFLLHSSAHFLGQVLSELVHEVKGVQVVGASDLVDGALDAKGEILGHETGLDGLDADFLQLLAKVDQRLVVVQFTSVGQTPGPSEDGGDRVGRGLAALLVDSIVAGDGAVGGLGLDGLAIGAD